MRHTPCGMHDEISLNHLFITVLSTAVDKQTVLPTLDGTNGCLALDLHTQFLQALHQLSHQIRVKAFEGMRTSMQNLNLAASAGGNLSELEGNIPTTHKDNALREGFAFQKLCAGGKPLLTCYA